MLLLTSLLSLARAAPEFSPQLQVAAAGYPVGAQVAGELDWKWQFYEPKGILGKDNGITLGLRGETTPSFTRVAPVLNIAPVAFFDATARLGIEGYYGTFSSIIPIDGPGWVVDKAERKELVASGGRTGGWSLRLDLQGKLKLKAGPVIGVLDVEARRYRVRAPVEFDWYWEPTEMLTMAPDSWVMRRNLYLFGTAVDEETRKVWIGALGTWDSAFSSGDQNVRAGPLVLLHPAGEDAPTFIVGSQAWIDSRFGKWWRPYTFGAVQWVW